MDPNAEYAKAKFLIYNRWETIGSHGGIIAGSLLLDHAMTEEEAAEKIDVFKARHDAFDVKFPLLKKPGNKTRFCRIVNDPHWWR
jgi:hypothetical protein